MKTIAFVGFGHMAQAIARGLLQAHPELAGQIVASARNQERLRAVCAELGIKAMSSNREAASAADLVFVCVKPKQGAEVLSEIRSCLSGKVVVSILAGKTHAELRHLLPGDAGLLCLIPNTPVSVGKGIFAAEKVHSLTEAQLSCVRELLESCGTLVFPEDLAAGAYSTISGCGPALVSVLMEAFADAAVKHGVPREQAYQVVAETFEGTAVMLKERGLHPGQLKDEVCSPGGTTIRGVAALEEYGARNAVIQAIDKIMGN